MPIKITERISFYKSLIKNIESYKNEFHEVPAERVKLLNELAMFVRTKESAGENIDLIFICTHNSRRSHISQIWAQAAAAYYRIPKVACWSGGTEATAFNPRAVKAMADLGFKIMKTSESENPVYEVRFSDSVPPVMAFSKKYDDPFNNTKDFAAVMTCSHANEKCPLVPGATARIALTYDDPKEFDGTPLEAAKYAERVHEIGRDILFAFSLIKE